jgi:hypothetical protein
VTRSYCLSSSGGISHHESQDLAMKKSIWQALNSFRFSHEPADRKKDQRLANTTVGAILAGLLD